MSANRTALLSESVISLNVVLEQVAEVSGYIGEKEPEELVHHIEQLVVQRDELLKELEKVTSALGEHLGRNWPNADHPHDRLIKAARAAIAKARGES